MNLLSNHSITKYHIKLTSIGIYSYCDSIADFKRSREVLTTEKFRFFAHDLKEETSFRAVVTGLEEMDVNELRIELLKNNVNPIDIRTIIPKRPRYEKHANYILYFNRGCTTIKQLHTEKKKFTIRGKINSRFSGKNNSR